MKSKKLVFRIHALQRMYQRYISEDEVGQVIEKGEVIEEYKDDKPFPSRLVLGYADSRPLHVVTADNTEGQESIVITVYEPTLDKWKNGFKERK